MRTALSLVIAAILNLAASSLVFGATNHPTATAPAVHPPHAQQPDPHPHPVLPHDDAWARSLVIAILALFAAAIPVGILVRANLPQELFQTHSHDEPPGSTDHPHHANHH